MSRRSPLERLPEPRELARKALARSETAQRMTYALSNRRLFSDFFQHDRMLGDQVRVGTYREAFDKHLGADDVVLDLGTGTGVLAFMAARRVRHVHAVEHGPLMAGAEAVARDNGIENVSFHRVHSSRLKLPEKVDAIIHEQIGEAAYDERAVENLAELRDRVLKPGGRIYPGRLDLFIEPVQLQDDLRAPFVWQQEIDGIDFHGLRALAKPSQDYLLRRSWPFPFGHFLCDPEAVVSIDLETATPASLPNEVSYERPVVAPGIIDGYCVYFATSFDSDLGFSSSPAARPTSWGNLLMRVESQPVEAGDTVRLALRADPLSRISSWSWDWSLSAVRSSSC